MLAGLTAAQPSLGGVFRCVVPVRWGDLDALNHVNNTVYFRYLEETRVQLFQQAGIVMHSDRTGVLAHASCDFLKPILYPETVVVSLVLARVGKSSMEFNTTISSQDDPGIVYAKGKNIIVAVTASTGKSSAWTAQDLEKFSHCFVAAANS